MLPRCVKILSRGGEISEKWSIFPLVNIFTKLVILLMQNKERISYILNMGVPHRMLNRHIMQQIQFFK